LHPSFCLFAQGAQVFFEMHRHRSFRRWQLSHLRLRLEVQSPLWTFACLQESHLDPLTHSLHLSNFWQPYLPHFFLGHSRFMPLAGLPVFEVFNRCHQSILLLTLLRYLSTLYYYCNICITGVLQILQYALLSILDGRYIRF
jgi:hypothetical protein